MHHSYPTQRGEAVCPASVLVQHQPVQLHPGVGLQPRSSRRHRCRAGTRMTDADANLRPWHAVAREQVGESQGANEAGGPEEPSPGRARDGQLQPLHRRSPGVQFGRRPGSPGDVGNRRAIRHQRSGGTRDEPADRTGADARQRAQECQLSVSDVSQVVPAQSTGSVAGTADPEQAHAGGGTGVTNPSAANRSTRSRTSLRSVSRSASGYDS